MELNRRYLQLFMFKSRQGLIIQIDVCGLTTSRFDTIRIHTKAVILAGNLNPTRLEIANRMIGTAMTESQFKSFRTKGSPQQLMTQTYAHDRLAPNHLFDLTDHPIQGGGIAGTVTQEHEVMTVHPRFRLAIPWEDLNAKPRVFQQP